MKKIKLPFQIRKALRAIKNLDYARTHSSIPYGSWNWTRLYTDYHNAVSMIVGYNLALRENDRRHIIIP